MKYFGKYLGKYRGTVVNNVDPMQIGRLQAIVPDISKTNPTSWAMPCVPFAGAQSGFFVVPPIGASVWVEFEQGDKNYPIWSGCFWGAATEVPALATVNPATSQTVVLQTTGGNTLMISDAQGPQSGILLKTKTGAMISISETGITIDNGQGATITMAGSTINVNQVPWTVD
jgi:uncharacterized protein involved in type VI secretion and phage assembly